jgi:hypothetical protein
MQTAHHAFLINAVPIQDLLFMTIVFALAALILFVLSVEAGNYPKIIAAMRKIRRMLRRVLRQRWSVENCSAASRMRGH